MVADAKKYGRPAVCDWKPFWTEAVACCEVAASSFNVIMCGAFADEACDEAQMSYCGEPPFPSFFLLYPLLPGGGAGGWRGGGGGPCTQHWAAALFDGGGRAAGLAMRAESAVSAG